MGLPKMRGGLPVLPTGLRWAGARQTTVVKALSNGKVGPRQRTLPTYLPNVDVPRPPPPT